MSFSVHKLETFSPNPGKVHFDGLVHLLRYIRDSKTLGLKYYADMKYVTLSDLLRQSIITNKNQLMAFSDSSWQYCTDTGRSTGAYINFDQGRPIANGTHITGPVVHSSEESEYNTACTTGGLFQLQIKISFPFLPTKNIHRLLFLMITCSSLYRE